MSGRCHVITLPDGSKAIIRSQHPNWQPTPADLEMIMAMRQALLDQRRREPVTDCDHEDDGEGTCLGCGAQLQHEG